MSGRRGRVEGAARVFILLAIGTMAGAAAFRHVHDLSVAHGQPDWIGWANAVAIELMAIFLGLEIRSRLRGGRPVGLVAVLLVGFACLSLAAQVAEAERSVWGWIVAAVPSMAFLALVKVVLSGAPAIERTPNPAPAPETDHTPGLEPPAETDHTPKQTPPADGERAAEPVPTAVPAPEPAPTPAPAPTPERAPLVIPPAPTRAASAVLPPLGVVHPARVNGTAVAQ